MAKMFSKFFTKKPKKYVEQRKALQSADLSERIALAKSSKTNKEMLYYLAEKDPSAEVRKAVAENNSAPVHVAPNLAQDQDEDVRLSLAKRLMQLLPDVAEDKQSQLYAYTVQALGTLALDEVLKIRVALSSTLKDLAQTPPKIAGQLARDVEREVSEPILRFCAALSDDDLLDILKGHPASWVIEAVAQRSEVSAEVSDAVIDTRDVMGGRALIGNNNALISANTLQKIVEMARSMPEWHEPIAVRQSLPGSVAKTLAEYVDASVRDLLMNRSDLDSETMEEVATAFRRRVDFVDESTEETPFEKLERLEKVGDLNDEVISDALAMREKEFVILAIAKKTRSQIEEIEKIIETKAPKAIVAMSWAAGLSMRTAFQLQKELAQIAPKELIYPKGGTDYPLDEDELSWQLDFLGLERAA